jgi:hypothetical protein
MKLNPETCWSETYRCPHYALENGGRVQILTALHASGTGQVRLCADVAMRMTEGKSELSVEFHMTPEEMERFAAQLQAAANYQRELIEKLAAHNAVIEAEDAESLRKLKEAA